LAALASLEAQGFSEASTEFAKRGRRGALASVEAQGFTGEEGTRTASSELGHRGRGGALASVEAQGFTGEEGTRTASSELGRRGGEARSAIYRKTGDCSYPGCTCAIYSGEFCGKHHPKKPEKSDKCRVCERVFGEKEKIRGGVCMPCYKKPEAAAARKKATAEKKRLEEHARHRAAMAGTIGVATSVKHACIPESLIEAEVATV
jgi:hypothetical protein